MVERLGEGEWGNKETKQRGKEREAGEDERRGRKGGGREGEKGEEVGRKVNNRSSLGRASTCS